MAKAAFKTKKVSDVNKIQLNLWKKILPAFAVFAVVFSLVGSTPVLAVISPSWPTSWITPSQCTTDPGNDENPSQIDLVGDSSSPAVGFSSDSNFMYFRERVGGNPGSASNPDQNAWVVLFQTNKPEYQYLGSVNGKDNKVQLWRNTSPAGAVDFSPLLNDPAEDMIQEVNSSSNVRITNVGGGIYLMDWAMPISWFTGTGITINTTKFFATSADANNFNKDHLNCYNLLADLGLTKIVDKSQADVGNTLTYTISVNNAGPDTASSTIVSDTIPTGSTYLSNSATVGSYNSSTGVWTIGSLASGATATLTLRVTVNNGTGGQTVTNTATASSQTLDNDPTNNTATVTTNINVPPVTTGTLTVVKNVTNDNGGTKIPSNFTLHVNGSTSTSVTFAGSATGTVLTLAGGSYVVSENNVSGYVGSFSGGCDGSGNVTVTNGQNVTCTITNDDQAAQLTVIKHVINDNGGNASAGDFTMSVSGSNVSQTSFAGSESGTTVTLNAGSYSVDETVIASGYAKLLGSNCSGTIANGESKTCTVTNNDVQPVLTVVKTVDNTNGGTASSSDFTIHVTGGPTTVNDFQGSQSGTVLHLDAGVYTVTEDQATDYIGSFLNCTLQGSVTLNIGDNKTCTITNTYQKPAPKIGTITVIKHVDNTNGGTKSAADFNIQVTATNADKTSFAGSETGVVVTAEVGTFSITETEDSGYSANYNGCSGTLVEGQNPTCTITNTAKAATLTVTKIVNNTEGGSAVVSDFTLVVTGNTASSTVTSGQSSNFAAGTYTLSEQGPTTGYAATFSGDCDSQGSITLTLGQTSDCTITNTYSAQSADIEVVKTSDDQDNVYERGQTVTFTIKATNNGPDLAKGVVIADVLPSTVTLVSTSTTTGSYDATSGDWVIGNLSSGTTVTLTVVVTVNQDATGSVVNTATGSSTVPDPNPDNNSSTVTGRVNVPTLTLTKTGDGNGTVTGMVNESESTYCQLNECRASDEKSSFVQTYASGTEITLTAIPDSESNFDGTWTTGPCAGSNNPVCTFTITTSLAVNAHFGKNTPPPSNGGGGGGSSGGGGIPVPPGQVLGTSTVTSISMQPVPQVLGESTTLPRTGIPGIEALSLLLASGAASAYLVRRKKI